jgi:hypothetical protein
MMEAKDFLINLVYDQDPLDRILQYIVTRFSKMMDLQDIGESYENLEEELCRFENWLDEIWGMSFYKFLVEGPGEKALPNAYRLASQRDANVLISDGFSLRELLLIYKAFPDRVEYSAGRAFHPTITQIAAHSYFGTSALEDAFNDKPLLEGREWTGDVIADIKSPPKIGNRKGLSLLTYYPDAPLHEAKKYGIAKVQDVSRIMKDIIQLVSELTHASDLVITGDHGYLYLGNSPNKYLWRWVSRSERHGGTYGARTLKIQGETMATGRCDAQDVRQSGAFIVHGGASLTESLVPVVLVKRGS